MNIENYHIMETDYIVRIRPDGFGIFETIPTIKPLSNDTIQVVHSINVDGYQPTGYKPTNISLNNLAAVAGASDIFIEEAFDFRLISSNMHNLEKKEISATSKKEALLKLSFIPKSEKNSKENSIKYGYVCSRKKIFHSSGVDYTEYSTTKRKIPVLNCTLKFRHKPPFSNIEYIEKPRLWIEDNSGNTILKEITPNKEDYTVLYDQFKWPKITLGPNQKCIILWNTKRKNDERRYHL